MMRGLPRASNITAAIHGTAPADTFSGRRGKLTFEMCQTLLRMRIALVAAVLATAVSCSGNSRDTGNEEGRSAAAAGTSSPADAAKFQACSFITVKDAEALFGHPATQKQGPTTPLHGECDWDFDAPDNSSQLLQLNIWTEDFYKQGGELVDADAQPFAIGERKGNIKASDLTGIDISWVEKGRFIQLSYSTVGPSAPKATTKVEDVKALAKRVSAAL
jgi:hypothetical protein